MEEFYTVEEVAKMLKVTRKSVYDWMRDGRLGYVQAGPRRRRITKSALDRFVRAYSAGVDTTGTIKGSIRMPGRAATGLQTA